MASSKTKTVALFGLFGQGNFGNDGSLEAELNALRAVSPQTAFVCICTGPEEIAQAFQIATLPIHWPLPESKLFQLVDRLFLKIPRRLVRFALSVKHLRRIDAIIVPGTGILDDFGDGPLAMPLTLLSWCAAAKLAGTRFAFVSIGAGPINNSKSRLLMKWAAQLADYRSYRDKGAMDFMTGLRIDTSRDRLFPDVAFQLANVKTPDAPPLPDGALTVAVGVMTYCGWECDPEAGADIYRDYLNKITRFIVWLLDRGHRVRVVIGDNGDRPAVRDVLGEVEKARPEIAEARVSFKDAHSLHDITAQLAETDVVVATRFHNIVCALKLCLPAISISYAEKNDMLMADMGLGAFCQHIEQLDVDRLIEQFTALSAQRGLYEAGLREANSRYKDELRAQNELLITRYMS